MKCNECGKIFEEPKEIVTTYESEYGVGALFNDQHKMIINCCPYCDSTNIQEKEGKF